MLQPITLYIGIDEGSKPDLAAVARAALAFEQAAREILFVLDPSIEVRIELDSGTEGSLKLNSVLKSLSKKVTDPRVLIAAAFTLLGWFAEDVRSYLSEQVIEAIIGKEDRELSDQDVSAIATEVVKLLSSGVGKDQANQVIRELDKDPKVTAVGATTRSDGVPASPIPRASFPSLIEPSPDEEVSRSREREEEVTVNLVSPVLLPGTRRWKFSFHEGEFGAPILDEAFLAAALSGALPIPMVAGITMQVVLRTREEHDGEAWAVRERAILKVVSVNRAPEQTGLSLTPQRDDQQK